MKGDAKMSKGMKMLIAALAVTGLLVASFAGVALAADPTDADAASDCPFFGERQGQSGMHGFHGEGTSDAISGILGLTTEEIQAQRLEGKSLVEIAAAQGVSEDVLVAAIMVVKTEAIQQRVADGTLTQERATLMLQNMEQATIQSVNRTTVGPFANGGGGCGQFDPDSATRGMHGRGFNQKQ
jgi:hypothetical protein